MCTTFAWFTSKDEVTNRLTASSDYGVSIVESFTPPKNWIPGQQINKDVYAVNTGNIDAFVNEDVKGVLNYTYETLGTFNVEKGVKLNEKEIKDAAGQPTATGVTTYEVASYLAWTDAAGETFGDKIIKADGSGWTPSAAGVYVFRRSITHDGTTTPANHPADDKFAYSGYYYDGNGNYYKIVLGEDNFPYANGTPHVYDLSSNTLGEGVEVDENGKVISGTPSVKYVNLEKVDDAQVGFVYQDKTEGYSSSAAYSDANHPARLVVTSNAASVTTDANGNPYNASAEAARTEVDYLNKKKESDDATKSYNQAKNDLDLVNAIIGARNTLINAARDRYAAYNQADADKKSSSNALSAVNTLANTIMTDDTDYGKVYAMATTGDIGKYTLVPGNDGSTDDGLRASINALGSSSQAVANLNRLDGIYDAMYNTTDGTAKKIKDKLSEIKEYSTNTSDGANALATKLDELLALVNTMDGQLTDYDQTYAVLKASTGTVTKIDLDNVATIHTAIEAVRSQLTALKNALTQDTTSPAYKSLKTLIAEFKTAAATMDASAQDEIDAATAWRNAVDTYNGTVGTAYTTYKKYCDGDADHGFKQIAQPDGTYLTDHSGDYADGFGLNGAELTFDTSSEYPEYTTIYNGTTYDSAQTNDQDKGAPKEKMAPLSDPDTGASGVVSQLKTAMDTAVSATNAAKTAYNNAVNRLTDDSAIKIYVNLAENYDQFWQFDPNTNGTDTASFYLKHILDAGKTSEMLIDSVKLDDSVTAASYKDMTFDLNVLLDSAQITYAEDQKTITDEAVTAHTGFGLKVKDAGIDQTTKAVTWNLPTN